MLRSVVRVVMCIVTAESVQKDMMGVTDVIPLITGRVYVLACQLVSRAAHVNRQSNMELALDANTRGELNRQSSSSDHFRCRIIDSASFRLPEPRVIYPYIVQSCVDRDLISDVAPCSPNVRAKESTKRKPSSCNANRSS